MTAIFTNLAATLTPLLAQSVTVIKGTSSSGPNQSLQWAIVLFLSIIGIAVTLMPVRRTYEVKKPKDE